MIYLGNFSCDELDSSDNYCLMPCIVEQIPQITRLGCLRHPALRLRIHLTCSTAQKGVTLWILLLSWRSSYHSSVAQWQRLCLQGGLCSITSALPTLEFDET